MTWLSKIRQTGMERYLPMYMNILSYFSCKTPQCILKGWDSTTKFSPLLNTVPYTESELSFLAPHIKTFIPPRVTKLCSLQKSHQERRLRNSSNRSWWQLPMGSAWLLGGHKDLGKAGQAAAHLAPAHNQRSALPSNFVTCSAAGPSTEPSLEATPVPHVALDIWGYLWLVSKKTLCYPNIKDLDFQNIPSHPCQPG